MKQKRREREDGRKLAVIGERASVAAVSREMACSSYDRFNKRYRQTSYKVVAKGALEAAAAARQFRSIDAVL